ncbi:MAG: radical SAM protein, partial [Candidatus Omnitrophota bacterium]
MARILLINPPKKNKIWAGIPRIFSEGIFLFPPLALMYLQAYLKKHTHHQTEILDALVDSLDYPGIKKRIIDFSPDIAGITVCTHNLIDVVKIISIVKEIKKSVHICLGGPHVRSYPFESISLPGVDSVIPGDGEITFAELAGALEKNKDLSGIKGIIFKDEQGRIIKTDETEDISNLDILPFPDRRIRNYRKYYTPATEGSLMTTMITSRGCPNRCTFCDTSKKYRPRSVENIADEIEECVKLGLREIFFVDDT